MSNWREAILNNFVPHVSRLTLVADPDNLLTEEKLSLELSERGFDLIEFSDPVEFRYAYESQYRSIWDQGGHPDLVVVLRLQDTELDSLPYDLLQAGRNLSFNLGDLFPNLSYSVIEKLDRSMLDPLYDAQSKSLPDRMGDNATKDFILRHVFGIAAEQISSDVELLRTLLRLHYGNKKLPLALAEWFEQALRKQGCFDTWPLDEIVQDDKVFFAFLQERWPIYLSNFVQSHKITEKFTEYDLKYPGPEAIPFAHHDIRIFIDNLFVEGKLIPVPAGSLVGDAEAWIRSGIIEATGDDAEVRISRLLEIIDQALPPPGARYSDWIDLAMKWAELTALVHGGNVDLQHTKLNITGEAINTTFAAWLHEHYASLINLPPTNPAMLHHVPRKLARDLEGSEAERVALIVVDGLALDQWVCVRQILQKLDANLVIRESAAFAWIPTLTSISRQSIFAGKPPLYFPASVNSTSNEGNLWKQFWESHGLSRLDVVYQRGLGDGDPAAILDAAIHPGKTRVVGLVVDKVDKIMHGMQLGAAGMHNQIKQWAQGGFLGALIGYLLDFGCEVWLTSDHGNIECEGKGRPSEGVIAETRGERVRVYPTPELRTRVATAFKFAHEWQPVGLPSKYFPLVAASRNAFITQGESIVGHGGIAIEEVIVPLVKFERRTR